MASTKNTNRRKRKYTEARKAQTDKNRIRDKERGDLRIASLVERTRSLIGKPVTFRTKEGIKKRVGTVTDVITKMDVGYPLEAQRHTGNYLKIRDSSGISHIKSRHRVKPVKETNVL